MIDYTKIRIGDTIRFRDDGTKHKIVSIKTRETKIQEMGSLGKTQGPTIYTFVTDDDTDFRYDCWTAEQYLREFDIVDRIPAKKTRNKWLILNQG